MNEQKTIQVIYKEHKIKEPGMVRLRQKKSLNLNEYKHINKKIKGNLIIKFAIKIKLIKHKSTSNISISFIE